MSFITESSEGSYEYSQLSPSAKVGAVENVRNAMYNGEYGADDIPSWVIDDCCILEPSHKELESIFGVNYNKDLNGVPMISNTRKNFHFISKDDRNYYLHCADSIDITNENMFLDWLGIPFYFHASISSPRFTDEGTYTKILLEHESYDLSFGARVEEWPTRERELFEKALDKAEETWEEHMSWVLDNITKSINYEYENNDAIIHRIEISEIKFDLEGNPVD
jgi:hypothetical protein